MLQVCIMKDKMKPNQKVNKHMIDGSWIHGFNVDTYNHKLWHVTKILIATLICNS
jgi:hypothetical protein